ncbi:MULTISPECIES: peptidyl-prolyl cis-trans isomerase [Cytobacillus]|uniref:peptidyl-prolyl cis-trans isomerase n=1 Tax=Cytobacillus TaxID=2675230 RepID=UPI001CD761B8|nr:peptidyl-prolyl cis-trans isomerase [Cytobacillus kochii]MCA1027639.1 peptidyl-prolyl cis-trans isomerase [Cytobacillus kochii]MCM3321853.1 peptidyl-prolyl cis-trans isomerase [Cytobacillus kochii]MCM3343313.1 peptidyl-prolyl cis-trans isomerase [Cytobacillus kochii]MDM5207144.1 peptidyl-prolyl cis-trans isomerase [Cytobacillus kochii]
MKDIIHITGNVKYTITLDPSVWIFDDRKIDLDTYFENQEELPNEKEEYTKAASKHWDREIMEGAVYPPTLKTEKKFEKVRVLTGTFGIPFLPFLTNAEPNSGSRTIEVHCENETVSIPMTEAENLILAFSLKGKPLKEDGPVHIYYKDGSNRLQPIKNVQDFHII